MEPEPSHLDLSQPGEHNRYRMEHASRLIRSFRHWTGRDLLPPDLSEEEQARQLYEAPFAVVSHNTAPDPIFNYANRTALSLFELTWEQFTALPSRMSAEPVHRDERARLMAEVTANGFIENYRGVRIASSGRRFVIDQAIVWNLIDASGGPCGQAAMFAHWRYLEEITDPTP